MELRLLSAADVRAALPMQEAVEAMRRAFGQLSAGQAEMPLRTRLTTEAGMTLIMPAYLRASGDFAIKIVSVFERNPERGLPLVPAVVLVIDPHTGMPRAVMEGAALTALRTGAGGGLAAERLAREDATRVAVFGAGVQARAQLQGVLAVRRITEVRLLSLRREAMQTFADEIAAWPEAPRVVLANDSREAVREADIVITATTSSTPVFNGNDLKTGAHVTAVGAYTPESREVDTVTAQRASKIVVDSRAAALAEAGDVIIPNAPIYAELGEIVNGIKPGRQSDDEITIFKSVGVAAQDAAAARAVLAAAEARGLGRLIHL